ncbi:hypothetical protein PanWU01x14_240180, partial [Parasponia andersonii]
VFDCWRWNPFRRVPPRPPRVVWFKTESRCEYVAGCDWMLERLASHLESRNQKI